MQTFSFIDSKIINIKETNSLAVIKSEMSDIAWQIFSKNSVIKEKSDAILYFYKNIFANSEYIKLTDNFFSIVSSVGKLLQKESHFPKNIEKYDKLDFDLFSSPSLLLQYHSDQFVSNNSISRYQKKLLICTDKHLFNRFIGKTFQSNKDFLEKNFKDITAFLEKSTSLSGISFLEKEKAIDISNQIEELINKQKPYLLETLLAIYFRFFFSEERDPYFNSAIQEKSLDIFSNTKDKKSNHQLDIETLKYYANNLLVGINELKSADKLNYKEKTGVFDGILFIKGESYGDVKSPEREIRLKEIFEHKENSPFLYDWEDIKSNTIYIWINRVNDSFFGGKKVVIKNGSRIHWTSENLIDTKVSK